MCGWLKLTAAGVISCRWGLGYVVEIDSSWCGLLSRRLGHVVEIDSSWCDLLSRRLGCVVEIDSSWCDILSRRVGCVVEFDSSWCDLTFDSRLIEHAGSSRLATCSDPRQHGRRQQVPCSDVLFAYRQAAANLRLV